MATHTSPQAFFFFNAREAGRNLSFIESFLCARHCQMPCVSFCPYHNPAGCWVIFTEWTFGNVSNLLEIPQFITGKSAFDCNNSTCELSAMTLTARHKCDAAVVQKSPHHITTDTTTELKCITC